jgi:localization factor PodJL
MTLVVKCLSEQKMSGSRSNPPGTSDKASLEALSRTIEGLEARIEGLIGTAAGRDLRPRTSPPGYAQPAERGEREAHDSGERDGQGYAPRLANRRNTHPQSSTADHLADIRQRQRALAESRERSYRDHEDLASRQPITGQPYAPGRRAASDQLSPEMPSRRRQPEAPAEPPSTSALTEIAQSLIDLRQDLKRDIAEGVAREMGVVRDEIRTIRGDVEDRNFADEMRQDLARLADGINQLASRGGHPAAVAELKSEFDGLRSLMDGLAREESLRGFDERCDRMEDRLQAIDTVGLKNELLTLAYRIDDVKRQLGGINSIPAVHALEEKLISIATAMEQLGSVMQPHNRAMTEQFSAIDMRLDEISRAIVSSGRGASAAADPAMIQRLDGRIAALFEQIELMGREAARRQQPADDLSSRIEALTIRIEEQSHAAAAARLEERLDQLSYLMERQQALDAHPDLTSHLADISRKIDALEDGCVNDILAERLDYLARRIDEMDFASQQPAIDDRVAERLEGRLSDIAMRLEQSTAAAPTDSQALRGLEEQIAHLSALMSAPQGGVEFFHADFDRRMGALEDYMSTNDEYIVEAARQAAETVVEAYARNGAPNGAVPFADMSALTGLADDLRNLEDLSRSSEERTHRTFSALHDTLVHIAERLDDMDRRHEAPRMPKTGRYQYAEAARPEPAAPAATAATKRTTQTANSSETVAALAERSAPIDAEAKAGIKAEVSKERKGSGLFAGFGKRFRAGRKQPPPAATDRPVIDPAPSIDPVEVVSSDGPDELLEPGSGAPDIKRILERVRSSQGVARNSGANAAAEGERADYIAAARRAAQAAAMEVDQAQRLSPVQKGGEAKSGSAFARYRRPIMLAVGAALLAIMAFPLVHTLTQGDRAPPATEFSVALPSTDSQPASDAGIAQPMTASADSAPADGGAATTAAASQEAAGTPPPPASAASSDHLTDPSPLGGTSGATLSPSSTPTPDTSTVVPADARSDAAASPDAAASAPAPPDQTAAIIVPAVIQPQSLADAAGKGDPLALFEIGARYFDGRGVPADFKQAATWYQLAADRGFAPAEFRLASMYEKGGGVDRDLTKAREYYERAANQGNTSSMHNLAVLFASGASGMRDYASAVNWFIKAANLGVSDSQFNLAILYARGNGVAQDLEESYKWFSIAARSGDKDAARKRDEVGAAIKPDQLKSAREKADQWKPQPLDDKANRVDVPDEWSGKSVQTASIDMKKALSNIQAILNNNGFDAGPPDGQMGAKTIAALKSFQKSVGLEPDGKVNDKVVKELLTHNMPKK